MTREQRCPICNNKEFAIEALEQEPCEDTISRQAVLEGKVIHQSCDGVEIINSYAVPVEYIEQLPAVTPQPKTGHWINEGFLSSKCSECGKYAIIANWSKVLSNFCPNCGTKMIEPQERSE